MLSRNLIFKASQLNKYDSLLIFKAQMSQRQVLKPTHGRPVKKVLMHREIIEEQAQKDYEKSVEKDGKLTKQQIRHLSRREPEEFKRIQEEAEKNDMPIPGLKNPFKKPPQKCILCEHNVELDFKNTRLLSQFVSPFTGKIYGRDKTGLCVYMQSRVATLIARARYFGYMPTIMKKPEYLKDPKLFDPFHGPLRRSKTS